MPHERIARQVEVPVVLLPLPAEDGEDQVEEISVRPSRLRRALGRVLRRPAEPAPTSIGPTLTSPSTAPSTTPDDTDDDTAAPEPADVEVSRRST
jgi:hypothetical protein